MKCIWKILTYHFFQVKVSEQDLNQPSILILPFLGLLLIAFFNKEKFIEVVSSFATSTYEKIASGNSQNKLNASKTNQYAYDDSQIDQIVQNINAIKKKPKPRKI